MSIKENTKKLIQSLPSHVVLVGVTKYSDREEVEESLSAGLECIGENRVDSIEKIQGLNVKKHFIGNIQSNKITTIIKNFDMIESVSSLNHIKKINAKAKDLSKKQEILIQLKISKDENKLGLKEEELSYLLKESEKLANVNILGFMMLATKTSDKDLVRSEFQKAKQIFDKYKEKYGLKYLSMGMSKDYMIAIEEGSNMIRVGSKIFK